MSREEKYVRSLEIKLLHGYYSGTVPVKIIPDDPTRGHLERSGIVCRAYGPNLLVLLRPDGMIDRRRLELLCGEGIRLAFDLVPHEGSFHHVTEDAQLMEPIPGVWLGLRRKYSIGAVIKFGLDTIIQQEPREICIRFIPAKKRLEYIMIPCYTDPAAAIRLSEVQDRLEFGHMGAVPFLDAGTAYRFVSTEAVSLSECCPLRIQLWEVRKSGERLMAERLPLPRYDEYSVSEPGECITCYFYY